MCKEGSVWRDITDPRRAETTDDLEAGLKEPDFENLEIPESFGPVQELIDDYKIRRFAFETGDYLPWAVGDEANPFGNKRIAHAALLTSFLRSGIVQAG